MQQYIAKGSGAHLRWPRSYAEGVGPPPADKKYKREDDEERPQ